MARFYVFFFFDYLLSSAFIFLSVLSLGSVQIRMIHILDEGLGFIISTEKWHLLALQGVLKGFLPFRKCYFDLSEGESELF